jgi:peroxiredoxin Q/BCP
MYGKKYMGIVRTTALIGPSGDVLRVWTVSRVKGHAENVLSTVEDMKLPAIA